MLANFKGEQNNTDAKQRCYTLQLYKIKTETHTYTLSRVVGRLLNVTQVKMTMLQTYSSSLKEAYEHWANNTKQSYLEN